MKRRYDVRDIFTSGVLHPPDSPGDGCSIDSFVAFVQVGLLQADGCLHLAAHEYKSDALWRIHLLNHDQSGCHLSKLLIDTLNVRGKILPR